MARPSPFDTIWREKLHVIEGWARDGLTDEQIAHNIGIATGTIYEWKKRYPEFAEALKNGKEVVDYLVENALLKRALGYRYTEITKERISKSSGQKSRHTENESVDLTENDWETALSFFQHSCAYCGDTESKLTKDHVVPLKSGGSFAKDNIVPCCHKCNSSKKDHALDYWYPYQQFYSDARHIRLKTYLEVMAAQVVDSYDLVVTKEVTKDVAPDTTAQIFWLKNRRPNEWREKKQVEVTDGTEIQVSLEDEA